MVDSSRLLLRFPGWALLWPGPGLVAVLLLSGSEAQDTPTAPLPHGTQSVEVKRNGAPVFGGVSESPPRLGTLRHGSRLPSLERVRSEACSSGWAVTVGSRQYVCEGMIDYSRQPPFGRPQPVLETGALLPFEYAFVRVDGARTYEDPRDYGTERFVEALGVGFGLVVTGSQEVDGIPFVRTRRRLWVEASALRPAQGSTFSGVRLDSEETLNVAFARRTATVHQRPRGRALRRTERREVLRIAEQLPGGWVRLEEEGHMRVRDLIIPEMAPPPEEWVDGEKWIDIDVATQTLVAYEGTRPVFTTLVSTGRRSQGPMATPLGVHRLWVKLAVSDMDNLEREDLSRNYAIESVPWVQYFEGANGFHAAFWHDSFGRRKSHGCVNLAPKDAATLFGFTEPSLPDGWLAIFATAANPGTLVRVR